MTERSSPDIALANKLDAIFDRITVSCDWRLSSEERQEIAEAANALRAQAATPCNLSVLVKQYAIDLRRNASGGDDYPYEYAKSTADYLETLIKRAKGNCTCAQAGFPDSCDNCDAAAVIRQDRDETLRGLAAFFSESVHLVWSNDEIADCLTGMIGDAAQPAPVQEAIAFILATNPEAIAAATTRNEVLSAMQNGLSMSSTSEPGK